MSGYTPHPVCGPVDLPEPRCGECIRRIPLVTMEGVQQYCTEHKTDVASYMGGVAPSYCWKWPNEKR